MANDVFSRCSICGRRIGIFEERFFVNIPEAPKGKTLWVCKECKQLKGKLFFLPDGSMKLKNPDGTISDTATNVTKSREVKEKINWKKVDWFKICFCLITSLLIFIVVDDVMFWKILGAILFFGVGWILSSILDFWFGKIQNKKIATIVKIVLCILLFVFAITRDYGRDTYTPSNEMCSWCEKQPATYGSSYCDSCYDKLF